MPEVLPAEGAVAVQRVSQPVQGVTRNPVDKARPADLSIATMGQATVPAITAPGDSPAILGIAGPSL
jgi:hypothetical protein